MKYNLKEDVRTVLFLSCNLQKRCTQTTHFLLKYKGEIITHKELTYHERRITSIEGAQKHPQI